jgi:hypothetical protein
MVTEASHHPAMSMTTTHHPPTGVRRAGLAGLLAVTCVGVAVAWATFAFASRANDRAEPRRVADASTAAAFASLTPEIVAPAYSADVRETALLEASIWRRHAAGEHTAALRMYAAALSTLTPEIVAPAYSARFDDAARLGISPTPAARDRAVSGP